MKFAILRIDQFTARMNNRMIGCTLVTLNIQGAQRDHNDLHDKHQIFLYFLLNIHSENVSITSTRLIQ